jgi:hypothetical protein
MEKTSFEKLIILKKNTFFSRSLKLFSFQWLHLFLVIALPFSTRKKKKKAKRTVFTGEGIQTRHHHKFF